MERVGQTKQQEVVSKVAQPHHLRGKLSPAQSVFGYLPLAERASPFCPKKRPVQTRIAPTEQAQVI